MKIKHCSDYRDMSRLCADSLISDIRIDSEQLICTATGNSPQGVYENLADHHRAEPKEFDRLRIVKLDEWGGIPAEDPGSCERFIQEKLLRPLDIEANRYIGFNSNPESAEAECERVQEVLQQYGPIDVCILGLGKNGHIGFNEPAEILKPYCHVAQLSTESLQHQMVATMKNKPGYGLTLGMANILQSKKIMLLVTGSGKKGIISKLLSRAITTTLPASFLWLHPNVECYIDASAL